MKAMGALQRFTDGLINILLAACCVYTVIIAVACVLQVFSRYLLNASFPWTEEAARLAWISLSMIGIPVALRKNVHVKIDVIPSRLKGKARIIQRVVMYALVGFGSTIFFVYGFRLLLMVSGSKGTAMRFLPMELIYATVPIGGVVTLWVSIVEILATLFPKQDVEESELKGVKP